jgi:SAM-dependent methyltransferase
MLRAARDKASSVFWIRGLGERLPFRTAAFDFLAIQFAFHHVRDRGTFAREASRVLRRGGRFVLKNICPEAMEDWIFYRYFPEAREIDRRDFPRRDAIGGLLASAGFADVRIALHAFAYAPATESFLATVRARTVSQLLAIPDAAFETGLARLEAELAASGSDRVEVRSTLVTIRATRG